MSDLLDELNRQLQRLALKAQQYPPQSQKRRLALTRLVTIVLNSGRLCRPQKGSFSGRYEDIYAEATQNLMLYICEKEHIDRYNPERGEVMTWVNMLLSRRFFPEAVPKVLGRPEIKRVTLTDLENFAAPEEPSTLLDCIREAVAADPEGLFASVHVRNHPEVTFQALLQRRLVHQRWRDIATELGISISTAQTFFSRQLEERFALKLREYCPYNST